jgi:hypothetical protein
MTNRFIFCIFGFAALSACGQAPAASEPAPEAKAPETQESKPTASTSNVTPATVGALAETVAVPRAVQVSDSEAEAHGPPTWLRNRQPPPKGVAVINEELETEAGR